MNLNIHLSVTEIANGFLLHTSTGVDSVSRGTITRDQRPLYFSSFEVLCEGLKTQAIDAREEHKRVMARERAEEQEKRDAYMAQRSQPNRAQSTELEPLTGWGEPGTSRPTHYDPLGQRPHVAAGPEELNLAAGPVIVDEDLPKPAFISSVAASLFTTTRHSPSSAALARKPHSHS